jgi:GDP-L-fucose synthase
MWNFGDQEHLNVNFYMLPDNLYNVGFGSDLTIKQLALTIQEITGHVGEIIWDSTKPDGTPRKWMDSSRLRDLGWEPKIDLDKGIMKTYKWFLDNVTQFKEVKM